MESVKVCKKCMESFPATTEYFYACKKTKAGLRSICKSCHCLVTVKTRDKERARLRLQVWRKDNPDKVSEQNKRQMRKRSQNGYYAKYYKQNKETINKRRNEWLRDTGKGVQYVNKRRSKMSNEVTPEEWQSVLDIYGQVCLVPGCFETNITQDHVIPLSKGGENLMSNLQPLCKSHNCSKGAKTIDYRPDKGRLLRNIK